MKKILDSVILCLVLLVNVNNSDAQLNSDCFTPNKEKGKCIPLSSCSVVENSNDSAINVSTKRSHCGYDGQTPLVCCQFEDSALLHKKQNIHHHRSPQVIVGPTTLPDKTICGWDILQGRIIGGVQTQLGEFPWLVALEYVFKEDRSDAGVRCGGSLINTRFVLTAAHCIRSSEFDLTSVRLGEWNLDTDPDCIHDIAQDDCADDVEKVDVEKIIPNPYYNARYYSHDIGLVKLVRNIEYTDFIRPICLPLGRYQYAPVNTNLTISGWGLTENGTMSSIKLKVDVPLLNLQMCQEKIRESIGVNQLCAGGEYGKDSCQGDSGGPLMRKFEDPLSMEVQWYQEGVISFGLGCGRLGRPAVYTRIDRYVVWIINKILLNSD